MRLSTSTCMYFNRPDGTKARIEDCIKMCSEAGYRVMDMNFLDCTNFDTPFRTERWEEWVHELAELANEILSLYHHISLFIFIIFVMITLKTGKQRMNLSEEVS